MEREQVMESFTGYVQDHITVATDQTVHCGPVAIRIVSNLPAFAALRHFADDALQNGDKSKHSQFELWCISLEQRHTFDTEFLKQNIDRTYRGASFLQGYYATDHFGAPAYLVSRDNRFFVFGQRLELVVWPYFVKYFLMLHSLRQRSLHLKAAAFAIGSAATLILGRGGAGKTVFLTQMCRRGARFIANTHSLIDNGHVTATSTAMRVRTGSWWPELAALDSANPGLKSGELLIQPGQIFAMHPGRPVKVQNLCIVDFRGQGLHSVRVLPESEIYDYAEQFALALNVYRLEEDLLDFYKGDTAQFSWTYGQMKRQLHELVASCRRYYASCDMLDESARDELFQLFSPA